MCISEYTYSSAFSRASERAPAVLMNLAPVEFYFIFRPAAAGKIDERDGGGRGAGNQRRCTRKKRLIAHCDNSNNNNIIIIL